MTDDSLSPKEKMLKALEAKKAKQGGRKGNDGISGGSKVTGGQRSGGAPHVQRKAGPSGSGAAG